MTRQPANAEIREACERCADWKPSFELTALRHRPKGWRGPGGEAAAVRIRVACERLRARNQLGTAIAAITTMIPTTIMISTRVKPLLFF
jgi:hypothetical protein